MAKINCGVVNCSHNDNYICYANVVNIGGKNSKTSADTSCGSFLDQTHYGHLTNNVNDKGNECTAITCNANTCQYNFNYLCTADAIKVNGKDVHLYSEADCKTFKFK